MAFRLSNSVIGALNLVTLLLSVPVLGTGIWLGTRGDGTECDGYLSSPIIALGAVLMAVSLAGLVGACCRVTWLLWLYLLAMFALIVALLGFTAFAFAVTNRGAGEAVSGRGYKEYRLGDYSTWLQRHVESGKNWNRIRSCLADANVCKSLQDRNATWSQFVSADLSPIQSGCCKPPTSCNFTYAGNGTEWTKTAMLSTFSLCLGFLDLREKGERGRERGYRPSDCVEGLDITVRQRRSALGSDGRWRAEPSVRGDLLAVASPEEETAGWWSCPVAGAPPQIGSRGLSVGKVVAR